MKAAVLGATGLGVLGVATIAVVWSARKPIGQRVVDDYLQARGIAAHFTISRLDAAGVSGSLIIGPRRDPDLRVERVDVTLGPLSLSLDGLTPRVAAIRLWRPDLKARFDGRRLYFGALQPLLAGGGTAAGPTPAIAIEDGRLRLDTPGGRLVLAGDGAIDGDHRAAAAARIVGGDFGVPGVAVEAPSGTLRLASGDPSRLRLAWSLEAPSLTSGAANARDLQLQGDADWPAQGRGAVRATAFLRARAVDDGGVGGRDLGARLQAVGLVTGSAAAPTFVGQISATLGAAAAAVGAYEMTAATAAIASPQARLAFGGPTSGAARPTVDAPFNLIIGAQSVRPVAGRERLHVDAVDVRGRGRARFVEGAPGLVFDGSARARGAMAAPDAHRIAEAIIPGSLGPGPRRAIVQALANVSADARRFVVVADARHADLTLPQPLRVQGEGGSAVTLSEVSGAPLLHVARGAASGGFVLRLAGVDLPSVQATVARYRVGAARDGSPLDAEVALSADGDLGAVRGVTARAQAAVALHAGRLVVVATACAPLGVAAYTPAATAGSPPPLSLLGVRLRLCPAAAPLLSFGPAGWRSAADVRSFDARLAGPDVDVAFDRARFDVQGAASPTGGVVSLDGGRLTDTTAHARFHRLFASGSASLANSEWRGEAGLGLAPDQPAMARLSFTHDPRTTIGEASLEATGLRFTPASLQPAQIVAAAAPWLSQVDGAVDVSAVAAWRGSTVTTQARVRTAKLDLLTPAGPLAGLRGDLQFVSLSPLVTAADQRLSADTLTALLPLKALSVAFDLDAERFALRDATATVAGGRVRLDPMAFPLASRGATPVAAATGALRLDALDAETLIDALNLSSAVSLQARLSGVLPFSLAANGLRLSQGRLAAVGPGRLTIRRQALTGAMATAGPAGAQPGAVQDFAYQALENLAFDTLDAVVASRSEGRLGVVLHVKGRHDPPEATVTRVRLDELVRGRAFDKPLPLPKGTPIDLTLDTSLNFDELLADYGGLRVSSKTAP